MFVRPFCLVRKQENNNNNRSPFVKISLLDLMMFFFFLLGSHKKDRQSERSCVVLSCHFTSSNACLSTYSSSTLRFFSGDIFFLGMVMIWLSSG